MGANHGNGALVPVTVDAGGIPTVSNPRDRAKRQAIASDYRSRLSRIESSYAVRVKQVTGIDSAGWQIRHQIQLAKQFKSQKRRLAAIAAAESMLLQYRKG